jgi:hypothetical protein
VLSAVLLIAGCGLWPQVPVADDVPMGDPACRAERYLFAGRGTLADLGLVGQSAAPLPDPERPAMIWVTEDHTLCFEFEDGSGGSDWPVDEAWQPPGANGSAAAGTTSSIPQLIAIGAIALGFAAISLLAFRRRQ